MIITPQIIRFSDPLSGRVPPRDKRCRIDEIDLYDFIDRDLRKVLQLLASNRTIWSKGVRLTSKREVASLFVKMNFYSVGQG
jgi:hypothetical protein